MTTIEMRKRSDPRDALLNVFGTQGAAPEAPDKALITMSPESLPRLDAYTKAVLDACEDASLAEVMAAAVDADGAPAPGRFINMLPTYRLNANGLAAWSAPGDAVATEFTGVPIRVKPYRLYWSDEGGKLRPSCASIDGFTGEGDPGGECKGCPAAKYVDSDTQYCKAKTRLYMASPEYPSPVVFDLTAMTREGLRPLAKWAGQWDIALSHLVVKIKLVKHSRKGPSGWASTLLVCEPVGIAGRPGYDYSHAIRRVGSLLDLGEQAWAADIADRAEAGGGVVDTSDVRYQYAGAVEAVQHLDSPALPQAAGGRAVFLYGAGQRGRGRFAVLRNGGGGSGRPHRIILK